MCCVDVGVSSAVLVSRQDEARSDDPPRRRRRRSSSPLPPLRAVSDLRLQQSPVRQRRQQVSHPGEATPWSTLGRGCTQLLALPAWKSTQNPLVCRRHVSLLTFQT